MVAAVPSHSGGIASREGGSTQIRLSLLRGFELSEGGKVVILSATCQRLLAFVALNPRPLSRSYVAGILWIESTEKRAGGNLRSALWRLNQSGLGLIEAVGECLHLARNIRVDVHEAEVQARRLLDPACQDDDFDAAELPYCGELLPAWYEDWVLIERERQRQLMLHALEALCERLTRRGRFGQAIAAGIAAVQGEPLRESAHRALIRAYLAEGNLGEVVRQYNLYQRLIREQLGLEPSTELRELVVGLNRAVTPR